MKRILTVLVLCIAAVTLGRPQTSPQFTLKTTTEVILVNVTAKDKSGEFVKDLKPEDFVIATGVQYSVRQFINWTAAELGMQLRWEGEGVNEVAYWNEKAIVRIDPRYFRPTEVETLLGDPANAKAKLGWEPNSTDFGFAAGSNTVTISRFTGGGVIVSVFGSAPEQMLPYLADAIARTLAAPGAAICEIFVDKEQAFAPKLSSKRLEDGTMVTAPLEDLAPFLPREELEANMLIPLMNG